MDVGARHGERAVYLDNATMPQFISYVNSHGHLPRCQCASREGC